MVVVHVAAMGEAVVPVLETFYLQGGETAWGLMSDVAATVSATVAATVAAVIACRAHGNYPYGQWRKYICII
jgi:hypothetical protein